MGYWYIAFVSYIQTLMKIYFFNSTPCKVRSLPISSGKYGCNAQILSIQGIRRFKSSLHQGPHTATLGGIRGLLCFMGFVNTWVSDN